MLIPIFQMSKTESEHIGNIPKLIASFWFNKTDTVFHVPGAEILEAGTDIKQRRKYITTDGTKGIVGDRRKVE